MDGQLPDRLLKAMAELGYFGIHLPEEWGGAGLDARSVVIATEELSRGMLAAGSVIGRNLLLGDMLFAHGTDAQRERYLRGIASGTVLTALASTEPDVGSDTANLKTAATPTSGGYLLTGEKSFSTFADRAPLLFVMARTDKQASAPHRGLSCFIVEKPPGPEFAPPTLVGSHIPTVGYHGMHSFQLRFDQHFVPAENLLGGTPNRGFYQLMHGYELARVSFAARAVGLAEAAYRAAALYSTQRHQFGGPLWDLQATRFKLADMATDIVAARQLVWSAATRKDSGDRCDLEAGMAKLFATEMAVRHIQVAMQLHGAMGFSAESEIQRLWRDSALLPVGEGVSEVQREVIAKSMNGRSGTPHFTF